MKNHTTVDALLAIDTYINSVFKGYINKHDYKMIRTFDEIGVLIGGLKLVVRSDGFSSTGREIKVINHYPLYQSADRMDMLGICYAVYESDSEFTFIPTELV